MCRIFCWVLSHFVDETSEDSQANRSKIMKYETKMGLFPGPVLKAFFLTYLSEVAQVY